MLWRPSPPPQFNPPLAFPAISITRPLHLHNNILYLLSSDTASCNMLRDRNSSQSIITQVCSRGINLYVTIYNDNFRRSFARVSAILCRKRRAESFLWIGDMCDTEYGGYEEVHLPELWLFQDALTKIGCRAPFFNVSASLRISRRFPGNDLTHTSRDTRYTE